MLIRQTSLRCKSQSRGWRWQKKPKLHIWRWNADKRVRGYTDTQTVLGYSSPEEARRPSVLIWWHRKAGRETGGRAGPTSTEAAEAAAWGMRNYYVTFRDRRGGFSLELKRSKEQLSCIPAVSYTSLSRMAFRFRVSRKEPAWSLCRALCLVHVCMCIFACMSSIHAEIRTPADLCSVRSGISCTYAP